MTTQRQGIIIALMIVLLMALGVVTGELAKRTAIDATPTTSQTSTTTIRPISYKGENGKSVLELLKRDHSVETIDSSFGVFVRSIDGVAAQESAAWIFYVDGAIAEGAADKAITQDGQTVEWRYETF